MNKENLKNSSNDYGYHEGTMANFDFILSEMKLFKDALILDVGAGNCWASNKFKELGCCAIALSIDITRYKGNYSKCVQADMHNMPFKSSSFDYVFFSGALHHSSIINVALKNANKILKKNGKLVLIGEPSYGLFSNPKKFGMKEKEKGINENIYPYMKYKRSIKTAGFQCVKFFFPPAIDMKLSTGKFGWENTNYYLFRLLHIIWRILIKLRIINMTKKLLIIPAAFIYNFQVHCIAEKNLKNS